MDSAFALVSAIAALTIVLGWVGKQLRSTLKVVREISSDIKQVPNILPYHEEAMSKITGLEVQVEALAEEMEELSNKLTGEDSQKHYQSV